MVHILNGKLLSYTKIEIMKFVAMWTSLESIMLNKVSQKERERNTMIALLFGI